MSPTRRTDRVVPIRRWLPLATVPTLIVSLLVVGIGAVAMPGNARARSCASRILGRSGGWSTIKVPLPIRRDNAGGAKTAGMSRFAVSSLRPGHIFATDGRTLVRSLDGGCRWKEVYRIAFTGESVPPTVSQHPLVAPDSTIRSIALSSNPKGAGHVYLKVFLRRLQAVAILGSKDWGEHWEVLNSGLPVYGYSGVDLDGNGDGLKVAPGDHKTLYLAVSRGFYVSDDGGATWARRDYATESPNVASGSDGSETDDFRTSCCMRSFAIDPIDGARLWAWNGRWVIHSKDGGSTWTSVDVHSDCPGGVTPGGASQVLPEGVDARGRESIVVVPPCTASVNYLLRSTDSGKTWHKIASPAYVVELVGAPGRDRGYFATTGPQWYQPAGAFLSTAHARGWRDATPPWRPPYFSATWLSNVAIDASGAYYACSNWAPRFGACWGDSESDESTIHRYDGHHLGAAADLSVVKTKDGCRLHKTSVAQGHWYEIPTPTLSVDQINWYDLPRPLSPYAIDPYSPRRIWVVTKAPRPGAQYYDDDLSSSIVRTTDGGCHWRTALGNERLLELVQTIDPAFDEATVRAVYLGTQRQTRASRVYVLVGATPSPNPLVPTTKPTVAQLILVSDDGGATWRATDPGIPDEIKTFAVAPSNQDVLYASTNAPGAADCYNVYVSTDGSKTPWLKVYPSPTDDPNSFDDPVDPSGLRIDPRDPTRLFSGSPGHFSTDCQKTNVSTLSVSQDSGRTWEQLSNSLFAADLSLLVDSGRLYMGLFGLLDPSESRLREQSVVSRDGGATWSPLPPLPDGALAAEGIFGSDADIILVKSTLPTAFYLYGLEGWIDVSPPGIRPKTWPDPDPRPYFLPDNAQILTKNARGRGEMSFYAVDRTLDRTDWGWLSQWDNRRVLLEYVPRTSYPRTGNLE